MKTAQNIAHIILVGNSTEEYTISYRYRENNVSSFFTGKGVGTLFYFLGWVLIIYCYFRVFSRNISKRYAENQKYLAKTYKLRTYIQQQKNSLAQRKVYHIYKCPGCKQKIRIPKGKGKIEIRCPKCGTTFIKKS